jgi:3-oxoacyl-[acyl-carrier-protein] synthase III
MSASTRIAGLGVHLPATVRTTAETEQRLRNENPGTRLATGLIARMTGVERVHVAPPEWNASDLAVAASRQALEESPGDVDLVIFSAAAQDLVEPATSHIVAAKLGVDAPVMDVKNACNSVLNGLEVGDALIRAGRYRRVLVASGEKTSAAVRWRLEHPAQFVRSFPGYVMGDAGAAVILEGSDDPDAGIRASRFVAESRHWSVGTLPGGGTMHPHDLDATYYDMDGAGLQAAFLELGPEPVERMLRESGYTMDDFDLVAIHQVALPYLAPIFDRLGVRDDRTVITVAEHGNIASATLPLQLRLARERGMVGPGSLALLIGLAGGISLGLMAVRL